MSNHKLLLCYVNKSEVVPWMWKWILSYYQRNEHNVRHVKEKKLYSPPSVNIFTISLRYQYVVYTLLCIAPILTAFFLNIIFNLIHFKSYRFSLENISAQSKITQNIHNDKLKRQAIKRLQCTVTWRLGTKTTFLPLPLCTSASPSEHEYKYKVVHTTVKISFQLRL